MGVTLCGPSALRVLREIRCSQEDLTRYARTDLVAPKCDVGERWSASRLRSKVSTFQSVGTFSPHSPLCVAVPKAEYRLRIKGVKSTLFSQGLPSGAFLDLGDGVAISSPELLFVEMAAVMDPAVHLLFGMELCGTYARDAGDPRGGPVTYWVKPATTTARIKAFVDGCKRVHGIQPARQTLEWLTDNAWSPMEATVAALAMLPGELLGYDLWPVDLNERKEVGSHAEKAERVPDMLFRGSGVGLNYDGEDHLPVKGVVDAAMQVARNPGAEDSERQLVQAVAAVRRRSVSDKRRDRDLGASGLTVFAITKEDLYETGALDRVMLQLMDAIEAKSGRDLRRQRTMMQNSLIAQLRQDRIWSLLPGQNAVAAMRRVKSTLKPNPHPVLVSASFDGDAWTDIDERML